MSIKDLTPGHYLRTWAGYTVPVEIRSINGELVEITPTGMRSHPSSMPDAVYSPADAAADLNLPTAA